MRKSYGQAYINMGGGRNSDEFVCWPTADLGFMDPAVGANVLLGEGEGGDSARRRQVLDDISQDTSAWGLAELFEAQTVIDPRDTRAYLIRALEVHRLRLNKGVGQHLLRNWPTSY
jgi:acetyl-CoA carboxylase carboxyltransferase component